MQRLLLGTLAMWLGLNVSTGAAAWNLTGGAGAQNVVRNDLVTDYDGQGYHLHAEAGWRPSSFPQLHLGLVMDGTYYQIESDSADSSVTVNREATLITGGAAPTITLMAPYNWVKPYVAAGYRYGSAQFTQDSTTVLTRTDGTLLTTDIYTRLNMVTSGSHTRAGLRIGQEWGVRIEYGIVYELWTVKSVGFSFSNKIDDEVQPLDGNDETYTSLVNGLVDERYHHVANTLLIAVDWMW